MSSRSGDWMRDLEDWLNLQIKSLRAIDGKNNLSTAPQVAWLSNTAIELNSLRHARSKEVVKSEASTRHLEALKKVAAILQEEHSAYVYRANFQFVDDAINAADDAPF